MEEDEQAERTLPEWVELEYKAFFFHPISHHIICLISRLIFSAYANPSRF